MPRYFVTVARGLEETLAHELRELGASKTEVRPGGVMMEAEYKVMYRAHAFMRTGNRILMPLREFPCLSPEQLYEELFRFKWETFFRGTQTLAVNCTLSGRPTRELNNSHFLRLKAKDAIVDRVREKTGERPFIDTDRPEISVDIFIRAGRASLSLDATGGSLHERGYRSPNALAPLKETLAAGIVDLSGWNAETDALVDPLCGTGTLLVEAGIKAAKIAPGLILKKRFCFTNWPEFNPEYWKEILHEAKARKQSLAAKRFYGRDQSGRALELAAAAWEKAGLPPDALVLTKGEAKEVARPEGWETGMVITNPPYGERVGEVEALGPLYKDLGDLCKQKFTGWRAAIFTGNLELAKQIGLRSSSRIPLYNGAIDCRLINFELH